jgi:hypothetical protein
MIRSPTRPLIEKKEERLGEERNSAGSDCTIHPMLVALADRQGSANPIKGIAMAAKDAFAGQTWND